MTSYRPKFKLRTKIIAWSFIPTAIIMLLVATMMYLAYQEETERVVINRDRELTRLTAGEISSSFEDFYDRLTALERCRRFKSSRPDQFQGKTKAKAGGYTPLS